MKFFNTVAAVFALVSVGFALISMVSSTPVAEPEPNAKTKLAARAISPIANTLATFWLDLVASIAVLDANAAAGVTAGMQGACLSVQNIDTSAAPITLPSVPGITISLLGGAVGTA